MGLNTRRHGDDSCAKHPAPLASGSVGLGEAATKTCPSTLPAAPKFSFGSRPKADREPDVPGPGSYFKPGPECLSRHTRTPKFSFGSASRQEHQRQRVPGPGAYTLTTQLGARAPAAAVTPRPEAARGRQKLPGPGSHNLPSLIGALAPKVSITPRRTEPRPTSRCCPGPGHYCQASERVVSSMPKWGFGTSPQRPREPAEISVPTPGPGTYCPVTPRGGPQFTLRSRT